MNIPFSPPDISEKEIEAVSEALRSGWITTGPRTKELERQMAEFTGTKRGACLNSATACMETALRLFGIGAGDEVIVPAYTYTASASVVCHVGATLKLIDVQEGTYHLDYDELEAAITEKTKAVIPVDIAGVMVDYDKIRAILESKKALFKPANAYQEALGRVLILADSAHGYGASRNGHKSGQCADFTSFSFHAVKNFTTAEGGAMTWNLSFGNEKVENQQIYCGSPVPFIEGETWNEFIYRISQLFSLHGQNKDALAKTKPGAWEYDIIGPWYKCNMTDIMAALGLVQFERYSSMLEKRQKYVGIYNRAIDTLNANLDNDHQVAYLEHKGEDHCSSHHLYMVRLNGRTREEANHVIEQMAERSIATNVHYKPLSMMTAYKAKGFDIANHPNAFHLFENEITLPLNTRMTDEDVEYVIENFVDIVGKL